VLLRASGGDVVAANGPTKAEASPLGPEAAFLDEHLRQPPRSIDPVTRRHIWSSAAEILGHGPLSSVEGHSATGLALGYVQSGKTTSITALIALAADAGYRVVVALLGVTNLLLQQNTERIEGALGIGIRSDYRWAPFRNRRGKRAAIELADWLDRGRVVLIPTLKHAGRLNDLVDILRAASLGDHAVLIVDDEADQASLNTKVSRQAESETYAAIARLRANAPRHLYVQYTATPYAPLLLEPDDHLSPDFLTVLHPGPAYTGGREFFVDHASRVLRPIPTTDEQPPRGLPTQLPGSLIQAFGSFVAGTALLLGEDLGNAPVSMLIHSTHKNDVQARYHFLLERKRKQWREAVDAATVVKNLPDEIQEERQRLVSAGARDHPDAEFVDLVRLVLRETTLWLVNSASDVKKIAWSVAPVHVLIGGNKLDRGFTVEGLTVTYMNRPTSPQIDTLEQRARAFGYREDLLPYCQFFASPRTLENLRGTVFTEYDLRAQLEDWVDAGGSIADWARHIGLMLPAGSKPTRDAVLSAVARFNVGVEWHSLRRPDLLQGPRNHNRALIAALGLFEAEPRRYGRLTHRTLEVPLAEIRPCLLEPWSLSSYSPGWRHGDILQYLGRIEDQDRVVVLMLLEHEGGGPRERKWDPDLGFVNLFQGADPVRSAGHAFYSGDRNVIDFDKCPEQIVVQVHRAHPRSLEDVDEVLTLAARLGSNVIVRRGS